MSNPYNAFDRFVIRTPLLSFDVFIKYLTELSDSDDKFKSLLTNKIIQEAIYIATPELFNEILKYLDKGLTIIKEEERFKYSIVRYLSRMSTRCTPFGIFAGCSTGQLDDQTFISLSPTQHYERHTRLDMNYLCALAQNISRSPEIKKHIKYFSNNSIYQIGDKIRYVEYFYKVVTRVHCIAAVDYSDYLNKVLQKASQGSKFNELANLIVDEEISIYEASEFIDELISVQLLVSELEPAVTGPEFLCQALHKLQNILKDSGENEYISNILQQLQQINGLLEDIDKLPIGETINIYDDIIPKIQKLETQFEPKFLFQTDMVKPVETAVLNRKIVSDILDVIEFLNKITFPSGETTLSKFREAFRERYEDQEMPLLQVLDNESGIGYNQSEGAGDINPIIDDLMNSQHNESTYNVLWSGVQSIIMEKFIEAKSTGIYTIELSDKDFGQFKVQWDDLPLTISVLCRILEDNQNNRQIFLKSVGGSSAANLIGRFCNTDKQLEEHVLNIIRKEEELNPEVIFAEIVHLPESRIGNILLRPVLRPYEIPYLAQSAVEIEYQIELSDLMISIRNGKILLRSKRLNKEIIPRLSSAHNYSFKSMPVYHFLCDMQMQNQRGGVGFNWGSIANEHNWLPRVKYKNVILSPARWIIKRDEIKSLMEIHNNIDLVEAVGQWRQILRMPEYVVLDDGDNELFVDMGNSLSIRTLLSLTKKRNNFKLEEFLYKADKAIVKGDEGVFTNEILLSFYKKNSQNN
jgi:hypothetical protein